MLIRMWCMYAWACSACPPLDIEQNSSGKELEVIMDLP